MPKKPTHRGKRQARPVPPLLAGADLPPPAKQVPSLEGQQALPGMDDEERERQWRGRRDEGRGQRHLF
jgi:hypothetical protein